jgi:proteasome lid subunit RPN8/RPN11
MISAADIQLDGRARSKVAAFLSEDPSCERGGFLIGRLPSEPGRPVRIDEAIPCPDAPATRFSLTLRPDDWQLAHGHSAVRDGSADIVGWFHSHPGLPVAMSSLDRFIQRHFFPHPAHVAWIRDPLSGDEAFWCMDEVGRVHSMPATDRGGP